MQKNDWTRRSLAKALVMAGGAATLPRLVDAQSASKNASAETPSWEQVHPGIWRARIGKPEKFTPVSSRLVDVQTSAFSRLPKVATVPLPPIEGRVSGRGCTVQIPLRSQEKVYGLGLQFMSFEQRGKKKMVRVNADPKMDTGDSHAPVPFYVTTGGIGMLIDTARYATFYFGDARAKPEQAAASVTDSNPDPNYTHNIPDADRGSVIGGSTPAHEESTCMCFCWADNARCGAAVRAERILRWWPRPSGMGIGFLVSAGISGDPGKRPRAWLRVRAAHDSVRRHWPGSGLADARLFLHVCVGNQALF